MTFAPSPEAPQAEPRSASYQFGRFLLALLSAAIPGSGQLIQRRTRFAAVLFAIFVAEFSLFFAFRAPATYRGQVTAVFMVVALSTFAGWNALMYHAPGDSRRVSAWWILLLLVGVLAIGNGEFKLLDHATGLRAFKVPGSAMEPTIQKDEKIMADFRAYDGHDPQRGDVVVVLGADGIFRIRRVIGIAGDTISIRDGQVAINGQGVSEPYVEFSSTPYDRNMPPVTVAPDQYYLLGDSRDVAIDSRDAQFGMPTRDRIKGRVLYILKSPNSARNGKAVASAPPAPASGTPDS